MYWAFGQRLSVVAPKGDRHTRLFRRATICVPEQTRVACRLSRFFGKRSAHTRKRRQEAQDFPGRHPWRPNGPCRLLCTQGPLARCGQTGCSAAQGDCLPSQACTLGVHSVPCAAWAFLREQCNTVGGSGRFLCFVPLARAPARGNPQTRLSASTLQRFPGWQLPRTKCGASSSTEPGSVTFRY